MKNHAAPVLSWSHAASEIPVAGLARKRSASSDERDAIKASLNLLALDDVDVDYKINRLGAGAYRLHGALTASLSQPCVVTLEPVGETLDETFDVEFWPTLEQNATGQDARILEGRDVETLAGGEIPVGRIIFETLSSGLAPYPKKPDAQFEWRDPAQYDPLKISPFAVLSDLKNKR